ncbi:MAG: DUF7689 domain-containing protein [Candidatus Binataceae bacterium]
MRTTTFTKEHLERVKRDFPKLEFGRDRVTSDETDPKDAVPYNCIAWAANDQLQWWEYDPDGELGFQTYWPQGLAGSDDIASWIKAFESKELGYKRTSTNNAQYEPGIEKIAIYAKGRKATHVARQIGRNRWTSKLGFGFDIEHRTLHSLTGYVRHEYGRIARVLWRRRR